MLINKCDVCGTIEEHMDQFLVPMHGYRWKEIIEGKYYVTQVKGVFPFNVHLCSACRKKIADYIESIKTSVSLN